MDIKARLAGRLRAARIERGLTQAEVGQALGVHRPTISEIEAGRRSVTSEELYELSHLLSIPVSDLLSSPIHPEVDATLRGAVDSEAGRSAGGASAGVDETILAMVRVIVDVFRPQKVILFGSHARGTPGPDSDVDLLVVMDVEDSKRRTGARVGAALHRFALPKDIVVTTPESFLARRDAPGTLERSVALEGKVLYGSG